MKKPHFILDFVRESFIENRKIGINVHKFKNILRSLLFKNVIIHDISNYELNPDVFINVVSFFEIKIVKVNEGSL